MKNQRSAYIYAILAVIAWSSVSTAFKLSLKFLTPLGLLLFSSLTASIFLVLINWSNGRNESGDRHGFYTNIKLSLLPGFLNPFLYYLVLFYAYDRLRAQEAQVLNYTWAIVLAVMSIIILKERFRVRDIVALLISFGGVILISSRGSFIGMKFDNPLGSILALSSSLIWASYWIMNMRDARPPVCKLMYNFLCGSIFIVFNTLVRAVIGGGELFVQSPVGLVFVLGAVYVGIFEMGLTFVLWLKALERSKSTSMISNLIFVTPFISLLFIALILKESIHPATFVGLVIIIGSNAIQRWGRDER
ncbi:MAG: DMT family transporter [Candidatus Cloacimonadaceae bacterium]|nr:DMT family transporter [Candidatus Cloacimonadaceae bacterium]MDP3114657.1 DMT family transporter [Candidatus Cloacimonadaceae bacterium]